MILALTRIVICSFKVLANVIIIVNYDRAVSTIVNYDHITFTAQATGVVVFLLLERST